MAHEPESPEPSASPTPNRLWTEQLAMGAGLLVLILIFMALFHPKLLSVSGKLFGPNDTEAYGWWPLAGIFLLVIIHELGTIVAAWRINIPVRWRFFIFGANASAILGNQPRRVWTDAVIGFSGPLTGTAAALVMHGIYEITKYQDASAHIGNPLFLGIACMGYFYNLFTLIPILDLEGGWVAPAIAPQVWLLGLVAAGVELTNMFNLVLLCVVCFALARFVLLLRARLPRTDLECSTPQRALMSIGYFVLVIGLAWVASATFEEMPRLVRAAMGD